jgi:hypothetical protein
MSVKIANWLGISFCVIAGHEAGLWPYPWAGDDTKTHALPRARS